MNALNLAELARTLLEESGDALFLFDPETEALLEANPMAQRLSGYTRQELLRLQITYLFRAEAQGGLNRLRQAYQQTGPFHSQEGFLLRQKQDGSWVPVNVTVSRLHAESRTLGLITARDIRERRRTEDALRASEEKCRFLTDSLEQCIVLKDSGLRFVAANRTFCQGLGLAEAEILGKTDFDLYPANLAEKYRADDLTVLTQGKRIELEEQNLRNGELCTVRVVKTPAKDAEGRTTGVLSIFWDVTQQRQLEAQLRQAQKMEAVGLLAGGIAHDFNNLLTAILGNLSLLLNDLPDAHPGRDLAVAAERASLRAADLTSQLLGFSRRTLLHPQPTDLNGTTGEVVAILRRTIDPRIAVEVHAEPELWTVKADPGQLSQVLMNLCINARDAMPEGGRLVLESANVLVTAAQARLHVQARPGEYVRLTVRDTGCGIAREVQARIFEPFFTTKGPGKGTGLGLAMVFGIVQQHEGWIECHSEPNRGTTFSLFIPRLGEALLTPTPPPAPSAPVRGRETILLVDDEEMIRNVGRTILQRYGYEVLLAEDGLEAVEVYRRERDRIDLVILDLTMPRLSGQDAFQQLRDMNPAVCVLFASGYSAEHLAADDPDRILGFIGKPYRPRELAQSVQTALEKKARAAERGARASRRNGAVKNGHIPCHQA